MNFIIDFFKVLLWHLAVLTLTRCLPESFFNPNRRIYKTAKWELDGKFYTRNFKIKKWKDRLPQYVAKNGFSKRNLENIKNDPTYISRFILETCRAEWNHTICSLYFLIAFYISSSKTNAIFFSFLTIITNMPFLIIQRYNRIRLQKLGHKTHK